MRFSLVIPCYNESKSIPALIERCKILIDHGHFEVVLVDNGSSDNTHDIIQTENPCGDALRCVRLTPNRGYGGGILAGLEACRGDVIGWSHADLQTDPVDAISAAALFLRSQNPENLFVKGTRYGRPLVDRFFTAGMGVLETMLIGHAMHDINAQPTLFHRNFFRAWSQPPSDFSLDLYAYAMAKHHGLSVARFPVLFAPRQHGHSHWNRSMGDRLKFIKRTLTYSFGMPRRLRGNTCG